MQRSLGAKRPCSWLITFSRQTPSSGMCYARRCIRPPLGASAGPAAAMHLAVLYTAALTDSHKQREIYIYTYIYDHASKVAPRDVMYTILHHILACRPSECDPKTSFKV